MFPVVLITERTVLIEPILTEPCVTEPCSNQVGVKREIKSREESLIFLNPCCKLLTMKLTVRLTYDDAENMYTAVCPTLPGCVSQGKTREGALVNIKDAMEGYFASLKKHNEPIPLPIEDKVVEVYA